MPSYILRNIDPALWARVKARSESEGIPLRAIILALLELYSAKKVSVTSTVVAKKLVPLLFCLLTVGCGGIQASPVAPSPTSPTIAEAPPYVPPPGPHFALELRAINQTTHEGDPWVGNVAVIVNPQILRPELPARVVTSCGSQTQAHPLGSGAVSFSCLLPVGTHGIQATAEMVDGRRFPTAINATVLERPVHTVLLFYDVLLSSRNWTDVIFGTQTFAGAEYQWTFGDGSTQTTLLNGTEHRYEHPGDEPAKERTASVRVVKDGKTLATGSVIGIW